MLYLRGHSTLHQQRKNKNKKTMRWGAENYIAFWAAKLLIEMSGI